MGPYARVKRNYKDVFSQERKKNPYYEADNTMVPVLAGDPIKKVPFAKERKRKRNQSSSSEKERVAKGRVQGHSKVTSESVANGHVETLENGAINCQTSATTDHAKEE